MQASTLLSDMPRDTARSLRRRPQVLDCLICDPMRSSSFFHWCPWIRDISYQEPFGETTQINVCRRPQDAPNPMSTANTVRPCARPLPRRARAEHSEPLHPLHLDAASVVVGFRNHPTRKFADPFLANSLLDPVGISPDQLFVICVLYIYIYIYIEREI